MPNCRHLTKHRAHNAVIQTSNELKNFIYVCCEFECVLNFKRRFIMWTTPAATEMRFGFEVTMYVMNK
jgi:coenzyme PQQ precursor peptide PqqA